MEGGKQAAFDDISMTMPSNSVDYGETVG